MAKTKKEPKAKEPIKLRFKKLANGNKSIYLDCYINGKRSYEFLKMYLIPDTTPNSKVQNQNTLQAANFIKSQKLQDFYNNEAGLNKSKSRSKMLLLDWFAQYKADQASKGRKDDRQINYTIKLLIAYRGTQIRLQDIDKEFCLGYIDFLQNVYINPRNGEHLKAVSAQNYYRVLNCAINAAIRAEVMTQNPFSKISSTDKIKVPESPREYLSIDEVKRLIATGCKRPEIKRAFLFSCYCGLRVSDIETLQWKDIHTDGKQYKIEKVIIKTKQPLYLPLSKLALKWLPERGTQSETAFVFHLPKGNTTNKVLQEWADAAQISKHVTFHVARHTFATMLLTLGADLYTTSKLLGHTDIQTTEIYAKIVNRKKEEAVNLVDGVFLIDEGQYLNTKAGKTMEEIICKETEYKRQSKGWFFVPWYCYSDTTRIDLMEMQAIISDADFNALQRLFSGEIQIPIEREDLDKYFCIEPYTITWELATYYRTLQLYNVAGKDEALFDTIKPHGLPDCTEQLLIALKRCMLIIQNNTNRPNHTRNQIWHIICVFDKLPIWGLLLQILILEGLCQMLAADLEKNEKNSGLNEMQDLRQWLFEILCSKEVAFCTCPYLDEMLLSLAPLCEFLCTTEAGKAVQKCIIEQYYQEDALILPAQLDTEKARKVFAKAIKLGYMEKQGNYYKWKLSKTLLACLCGMLYCGDKSENGYGRYYSFSSTNKRHFPNIALEKLFNEQHLRVLREQKNGNALPRGFQKIEQLFE